MPLPTRAVHLALTLALAGCRGESPEYAGGWTPGPPLPEAVQELHAAVHRGSIYVAGGIAGGSTVTARTYRLDSAGTAWARVADLPAPRHHMPLVVAADSLYAVGGFGPG
jgi:N-acetylneuraminic acid mutarotase